jgi:uncharacterized damage-inducible protein DinB
MKLPDLKAQLLTSLTWEGAHASLETAVDGLTPEMAGIKEKSFPYTIWQLLEHLRITQKDIIDFCMQEVYQARNWPDDYWPKTRAPESEQDLLHTIKSVKKDLADFSKFIKNPELDLLAKVPNGKDQTFLREVILVIDHNAYHTGQIILLRKMTGNWPF